MGKNWLDNLIEWVSPRRGAQREAWRKSCEDLRNYDAGSDSRLNDGWRVVNQSAEMTDRGSRDILRARARDLERNSDIMNSVLGAYKRNVIGPGFQLQSMTPRANLNKELEGLWKRWCKARNCDVTGMQSLNEILRMAVVRKKVDGGILFVKRYTNDGMIPFKIQMIEVDELDDTWTGSYSKGNRVVGGIEYTKYGRPVGYWVRQYSPDGYSMSEPVHLDAEDVIFYHTKKRPSQYREVSDMSQTLTRIRDVNEYMTAVSVKQRIEACLSVFVKKQYPPSSVGRSGSAASAKHNYDGKMLTPGMIHEMNVGDDVQVVNPTGQSSDATSFVKLQQRLIGAGQGISYEATSRDMSETNYSSARQGSIEDELTFVEEQEQIIEVLDEIYETFVISCVLSGWVDIKDFWDRKDKYLQHEWIKQPKKWIDPQKESSATETAMKTGQKTFKQIAAESGKDWRRQIDDIADVLEYGKKKGIDLSGVIFDGKLDEVEDEDDDDADGRASEAALNQAPASDGAGTDSAIGEPKEDSGETEEEAEGDSEEAEEETEGDSEEAEEETEGDSEEAEEETEGEAEEETEGDSEEADEDNDEKLKKKRKRRRRNAGDEDKK